MGCLKLRLKFNLVFRYFLQTTILANFNYTYFPTCLITIHQYHHRLKTKNITVTKNK